MNQPDFNLFRELETLARLLSKNKAKFSQLSPAQLREIVEKARQTNNTQSLPAELVEQGVSTDLTWLAGVKPARQHKEDKGEDNSTARLQAFDTEAIFRAFSSFIVPMAKQNCDVHYPNDPQLLIEKMLEAVSFSTGDDRYRHQGMQPQFFLPKDFKILDIRDSLIFACSMEYMHGQDVAKLVVGYFLESLAASKTATNQALRSRYFDPR